MKRAFTASVVTLLFVSFPGRPPTAVSWDQARVGQAVPPSVPTAWPDAAALAGRRREAERLPLFASAEPFAFTLVADFGAVDRDRDPESRKTYPATISSSLADGMTWSRSIRIRGRGHSRRGKICDFTPLLLEFTKDQMAGTVFAGHDAIKLGTHCRAASVFEQYVLREYTAYRILNLLTPYSFRVRLARATYVDAASQKRIDGDNAMFIEDDDDVAKRMEGRINESRVFPFPRLNTDYLTLVTVFEYMIGNTDVGFVSQHNVRVVETPSRGRYAVPYDFDYSGLVDTVYALVDTARLPEISTVRERRYIGPCRTATALEPAFAKMRAAKDDIYALYDQVPGFTDRSRRDAKAYLDRFYRTIDRPGDVKRAFIDTCMKTEPEERVVKP